MNIIEPSWQAPDDDEIIDDDVIYPPADPIYSEMVLVYPIDEYGFVMWGSELFREVPIDTELADNEITEPIPPEANLIVPRWQGRMWIEGKDHPNVPPPPDLSIPGWEQPTDGVYWIITGEKSLSEMTDYLMSLEITEDDIINDTQHISDVRVIPILIKMIQDMKNRLDEIERR